MTGESTVTDGVNADPPTRVENTVTVRIFVLTLLVAAADFVFGAVYVQVLLERGVSPAVMGIVFFATFLITSLVEIPSGDWGDRYGQRRMTILGLLAWGAGLGLFGLFASPIVSFVGLLLWSIGQAMYSGAPISLAINSIDPERQRVRRRLVRFASVFGWVGSAAGGLLVLIGAITISVSTSVLVAGVGLLVVALWVRVVWPESELLPRENRQPIVRRVRANWTPAMTDLLVLSAGAAGLLSTFLFAWQPVTLEILGLPEASLGLVLLGLTVVAALGAAATRFEVARLAAKNVDAWGLLLISAAATAVAGLSPIAAIVAFAVIEFCVSALLTIAATRAHGEFPDAARNLLWSIFGWCGSASMAVSDLIFGFTWQVLGLRAGLAAAIVLDIVLIIAMIGVVRLRRRVRSAARRPV